jgi:hypothetical protein
MDSILFAGTYTQGVWKRPVSEVTGVREQHTVKPGIRVWPNPSNGVVSVCLPGTEIRDCRITDSHGAVVLTFSAKGGEPVTIDLGRFAAGLYVVRVEGAPEVHEKLVKL